jgi:hypothetical protein
MMGERITATGEEQEGTSGVNDDQKQRQLQGQYMVLEPEIQRRKHRFSAKTLRPLSCRAGKTKKRIDLAETSSLCNLVAHFSAVLRERYMEVIARLTGLVQHCKK